MQWTVVGIASGVGLTGRGLPSPVSNPHSSTPINPTPPALRAPPPPARGGGSHGDTRWKAVYRSATIESQQVGFQQSQDRISCPKTPKPYFFGTSFTAVP